MTGCKDHFYLEKLSYTLATSYDVLKTESNNDNFKIGFSIPSNKQDKQVFISTVAKTNNEALKTLSRENNFELVKGQLRIALLGKEYAKLGIIKELDTFVRDPTIRGNVKLITVDGDAGELLSRSLPQNEMTSLFLDDLLLTTEKTSIIPETNLYTFARDLYDEAIDPIMPVIKKDNQKLFISGIGLFQSDKLVEILKAEHLPVFRLLHGSFNNLDCVIKIHEEAEKVDSQVGLFHISGERNISVSVHHPIKSGKDLKVTIGINVIGAITEYTGSMKLEYPTNQLKLEAYMNRYFEQEAEKLVDLFQKRKIDPLGIGQFVRQQTSHSEWKTIQWRDVFETADIRVKANVKMKNYGEVQH